jgi:hypothetical protein
MLTEGSCCLKLATIRGLGPPIYCLLWRWILIVFRHMLNGHCTKCGLNNNRQFWLCLKLSSNKACFLFLITIMILRANFIWNFENFSRSTKFPVVRILTKLWGNDTYRRTNLRITWHWACNLTCFQNWVLSDQQSQWSVRNCIMHNVAISLIITQLYEGGDFS